MNIMNPGSWLSTFTGTNSSEGHQRNPLNTKGVGRETRDVQILKTKGLPLHCEGLLLFYSQVIRISKLTTDRETRRILSSDRSGR